MHRKKLVAKMVRTSISDIIVVLIFLAITYLAIAIFEEKYTTIIQAKLDQFTKVASNNETKTKLELDSYNKKIKEYPSYGEQYATVNIDAIDLELPLFYGDSLEILKKGIGQSTASYFPGEDGSIICMGHNYETIFRNFSELQKGDIIKITTDYGEFNYKIYDMQIIGETQVDKVPLQDEEEILMMYTCYPFKNVGYTTKRYVVYAKPV